MKGDSLTKKDVPKYIREIAQRLRPVPTKEMTFALYGKWARGYIGQLEHDAAKLVAWANRHYAEAEVVSFNFWLDRYDNKTAAARAGFKNHVVLKITDPAAHLFERNDFFRFR